MEKSQTLVLVIIILLTLLRQSKYKVEGKFLIVDSSKKELKDTTPKGDIILKSKLKHIHLLFSKNYCYRVHKQCNTLFIQEFAKIAYKTYQNRTNHIFLHKQKYNLQDTIFF